MTKNADFGPNQAKLLTPGKLLLSKSWAKLYELEKSAPPPVVVVVNNMSFANGGHYLAEKSSTLNGFQ